MRSLAIRATLLGLLLVPPAPAAAQEVATAVLPDTVRVGDVFRAAVRIALPPGYRAELPDSLPLVGEVEHAGRRGETVEELNDGGRVLTVVYPLSAWRPGRLALPTVSVRVEGPDGGRTFEAPLPELAVRSILPSDTAGVRPRGLKDVLGASRLLWPLILALLGGMVAVGGLLYWRSRGRVTPIPVAPPLPPRERAIAALDRARESGLLEDGRLKPFYSLVTDALRTYLEALNRDWGADLTTTELLEHTSRAMQPESAAGLERLLRSADLVKFARRPATSAEALVDWEAARSWVLGYEASPAADGFDDTAPGAGREVA